MGYTLQISAGSQESYRSYRLVGWLKPDLYTYISNLCRDSNQKKILKLPTATQVKLPFWWFLHIFIHHPSYCLTHPSWIRAGGHPRWVRSCLHRRRRHGCASRHRCGTWHSSSRRYEGPTQRGQRRQGQEAQATKTCHDGGDAEIPNFWWKINCSNGGVFYYMCFFSFWMYLLVFLNEISWWCSCVCLNVLWIARQKKRLSWNGYCWFYELLGFSSSNSNNSASHHLLLWEATSKNKIVILKFML